MSKYLKKTFVFLFRYLKRINYKIRRSLTRQVLLRDAIIAQIKPDNELGEDFYCVSEETLVKMPIPRVYNHISNGAITFKTTPKYIRRYSKAMVFPTSDFVVMGNAAIWPKYYYAHYTKIVPLDRQLIKIENSSLYIKKPKKVYEKSIGFSLCGVHSTVWSHFLVQFLPKIEHIDKILNSSDDIVTLITPYYLDHQINEIILKFTKGYNNIELLKLNENETVLCNTLYHLENTSVISDHAKYISPSDIIIPYFVKSFLKEKFAANPLIFTMDNCKNFIPKRKLYIGRKKTTLSPLSNIRVFNNAQEIEEFFKNEGFEFIFPHEYSLEEKRNLFSEAAVIAGPGSSGFSNIIFCQPGTKVLAFLNFQRVYDTYLSPLAEFFNIDVLIVTGTDTEPGNIHSSYSISLESVKAAYKELMSSNEQ